MSPSETIKLFKRHVNQKHVQYLTNIRLERSINKLYHFNAYTITEVAMSCGFSSTSYFIQLFKREYGITPKQFQKLFRLAK